MEQYEIDKQNFDNMMKGIVKSDACHCHMEQPEDEDLVLLVIGVKRGHVELLHAICNRPLNDSSEFWDEFIKINDETMNEMHPTEE